MKIPKRLYEKFEGKLDERVRAFRVKMAEHAKTEDVPAPVEDPLVEQLAQSDIVLEIVDDPEPPPPPELNVPYEDLPPPPPLVINEADHPDIVDRGEDRIWHSALEFKEEFTQQERVKMRKFARTDDMAEDFLDMLNAASSVNPTDGRVIVGLQYFVDKGVLTDARVKEVLAKKQGGQNA